MHLFLEYFEAFSARWIIVFPRFAAMFLLASTDLSRRTGGSESFGEKRIFFSSQLVKHHEGLNHQHRRLPVQIDRFNVFESTYR